MIRIFDFLFSLIGLIILLPLLLLIFLIGLFDNGLPLFIQSRVGYNLKSFSLIKFRTMPVGVRSAGTHLIKNIKFTLFGSFLRRTKIDEVPQLFNVLFGDMSLVGPRPCLFNQKKLISEEFKYGDDGLTLFIIHTWADKLSYSDYVNSPEMLEWRIDRSLYNSNNNITFELYSILED